MFMCSTVVPSQWHVTLLYTDTFTDIQLDNDDLMSFIFNFIV